MENEKWERENVKREEDRGFYRRAFWYSLNY